MSTTALSDERTPLAEATFDAVIFDMDGTLLDSTPAVERSWIRWAQEQGIDPHQLVGTQGRTARSIIEELVPAERVEESLRRIIELETADTGGIVLLPGVAAALAALRDSRWAIATSCTRALAEVRIAAAELPPPSVLVSADDVQHSKPAPDAFLQAAERLGVPAKRCLVVEDALNGVKAARAAGAPVMAVGTTMTWDRLEADVVVPDLSVVEFRPLDGRVHVTVWAPEAAED